MWKSYVLGLYLAVLTGLVFGEEPIALTEIEEDNNFGGSEFNDTDGNIVPQPRYARLNINEKVYTFNLLPVNWHTARELCAAQNQVIASVHNADETVQLIGALFKNNFLYNMDMSFWIGGSQLGHIGQWSWASTGRNFMYNNWQHGEPQSYCQRNCVVFLSDGRWKSGDCDEKRPVICENLPSCNSQETSLYG